MMPSCPAGSRGLRELAGKAVEGLGPGLPCPHLGVRHRVRLEGTVSILPMLKIPAQAPGSRARLGGACGPQGSCRATLRRSCH